MNGFPEPKSCADLPDKPEYEKPRLEKEVNTSLPYWAYKESFSPLIKDCAVYRSAIIEKEYTHKTKSNSHIGDFIEQTSKRNKNRAIQNVLSVSNRQGFIQQSEQFENRSVASDDTSSYKIVKKNNFAFNPARINVGSIARLTTFDRGIVSPMYICFRTKDTLFPEYLE